MSKLDREEQRIHDAFSRIDVDTHSLKRRMNNMEDGKSKGRVRFSVVFAAALIVLTISVTAFAAVGGLEQFISRFNPAFGDLAILPAQPVYAEDQGIRMEVIGAQQISGVVLAYVTMQDVNGENRLSRDTWPDLEIFMDGEEISGPSSYRLLHFDRVSNTVYFEIIMATGSGIPKADTLEIGARSIAYTGPGTAATGRIQTITEGEWLVRVNTNDADNRVLVWTDIPADNLHIEYLSLSALGVQIVGRHEWELSAGIWMHWPEIEIEVENRRRNIRPSGSGGGTGEDFFEAFFFVDSPIGVEAVTAVIVDGVRITVSQAQSR